MMEVRRSFKRCSAAHDAVAEAACFPPSLGQLATPTLHVSQHQDEAAGLLL